MTAKAHIRGHEVFWDRDSFCWRYDDDDTKCETNKRKCVRCDKYPTKEGYDACKGFVPGAKSVCCGHGVSKPILIMEKNNEI